MPCSAVTLSLATITSIIAVALLAIAFATDNWLYIEVKRTNIQNFLSRNSDIQSQTLLDAVNSKYYYYTRTKGLFRTCFPKERPPTVKLYLSPVETYCTNINYYIPDENNETKDFTDDAWTRLHMGRSMIALFIISFFSVFAAFCTGVTGCWRRSPGNITATAILMLLACLLSAGAMGLWHGVEYYEKEKQVGEEFYQQWSTLLQDNATIYYDWGFALGWLGVFSCLGGSLLFFFGSCCLQAEKDREQLDNVQYIVPGQEITKISFLTANNLIAIVTNTQFQEIPNQFRTNSNLRHFWDILSLFIIHKSQTFISSNLMIVGWTPATGIRELSAAIYFLLNFVFSSKNTSIR